MQSDLDALASPTTLDPADWEALRANAHALLDASIERLKLAKTGRTWTPTPDALKENLSTMVPPTKGMTHEELTSRLQALLPYGVGNTHPRFFGWVHGAGNPGGVLPELVGAALNANCGGRDHAAIYVEKQVLAWCRAIMGFPTECGALLVSGTSMATIIALKAARDSCIGFEQSRKGGLIQANESHLKEQQSPSPSGAQLVGYAAAGAHSCIKRAFDMLGLGSDQLRAVACRDDFTMDLAALANMVAEDRQAGKRPFVVIGTAGSVNVGAIDNLDGIADFAQDAGIWFHVDGAFGAPAMLSVAVAPRLKGLERASSLAFDFHKWLHVNYDAGCVLVRDRDTHLRAFSERPDYLAANERGLAAGSPWPVDYGPELSRGFRALKVWSHFLEHGTQRLGDAIDRNLEHARHLATLVDRTSELHRMAPVSLQIVVFRFVPAGGAPQARLDALNDEIVVELHERGIAAPSTTRIHGELGIRVNLTNHRTRFEDLDLLVAEVCRLGAELCERSGGP